MDDEQKQGRCASAPAGDLAAETPTGARGMMEAMQDVNLTLGGLVVKTTISGDRVTITRCDAGGIVFLDEVDLAWLRDTVIPAAIGQPARPAEPVTVRIGPFPPGAQDIDLEAELERLGPPSAPRHPY